MVSDAGPPARLHADRARLGSGAGAAAARSLPRAAPDLRGPRRCPRRAADRRRRGASSDVAAAAPRGATLGGYSLGGRVALHAALRPARPLRRASCSSGRRRASPTPAERARAPGRRRGAGRVAWRARRSRRSPTRWGAQPLFATSRRRRAAGARRPAAQRPARPGRGAARGSGTGAMEPMWDRLDELDMPVDAGRRRARREVRRRSRRADGRADRRRGASCVVPGRGHAVHLEAPDAVAAGAYSPDRRSPGPPGGPRTRDGRGASGEEPQRRQPARRPWRCSAAAACTPAAMPTGPS